jgi:hypothetical protein
MGRKKDDRNGEKRLHTYSSITDEKKKKLEIRKKRKRMYAICFLLDNALRFRKEDEEIRGNKEIERKKDTRHKKKNSNELLRI